jgi:hypothetical protein
MSTHRDLVAQGQQSLQQAGWQRAKDIFEQALHEQDTPEAHDGLGLALWWLNHVAAAHEQRTLAYLGYKASGDHQQAAYIAAWLAREQLFLRGNTSAMLGWFARAESLLEGDAENLARGWLDIYRATMTASIQALKETAQRVTALARRLRQPDLETFALANTGYAIISMGRVGSRHGED